MDIFYLQLYEAYSKSMKTISFVPFNSRTFNGWKNKINFKKNNQSPIRTARSLWLKTMVSSKTLDHSSKTSISRSNSSTEIVSRSGSSSYFTEYGRILWTDPPSFLKWNKVYEVEVQSFLLIFFQVMPNKSKRSCTFRNRNVYFMVFRIKSADSSSDSGMLIFKWNYFDGFTYSGSLILSVSRVLLGRYSSNRPPGKNP